MIQFSVVIPVYNEEASVVPLYDALTEIMERLGATYEIIFVNDGSYDKTLNNLNTLQQRSSFIRVIDLMAHRGQSQAFLAGMNAARGELIITMDGDLQNDPRDIPKLMIKFNEGEYDVICGWRHIRKDPWLRIISYKVTYPLRTFITREPIHDFGCSFRIFKKSILENIRLENNWHPFFTLIAFRIGFKLGEVEVCHHRRKFGVSKYNIRNRLCARIANFIAYSFCDVGKLKKVRE